MTSTTTKVAQMQLRVVIEPRPNDENLLLNFIAEVAVTVSEELTTHKRCTAMSRVVLPSVFRENISATFFHRFHLLLLLAGSERTLARKITSRLVYPAA